VRNTVSLRTSTALAGSALRASAHLIGKTVSPARIRSMAAMTVVLDCCFSSSGGFVMAPRGVPHAFLVLSDTARLLCLHTPGSCQAFYWDASEPIDTDTSSGALDFARVQASAHKNGGIEILGPPPFAQPSTIPPGADGLSQCRRRTFCQDLLILTINTTPSADMAP
jgi:hypothetical protein